MHRRQLQALEGGDCRGNGAQHHPDARLLHEGVYAKAADTSRADGKVALLGGLEFGSLLVIHDGTCKLRRVLRCQALVRLRRDLAIHLDGGRETSCDEQV
jgi:hypothetical protein